MSYDDQKRLLEYCERELQSARTELNAQPHTGPRFEKWEDVPEALALPYAQVEWLVDGIVPLGGFTILAGESGVGKTWFALLAAMAVACGRAFIGRACRKAPVLYLDRENPVALVYQRLAKLGALPLDPAAERNPGLALSGMRLWGGWCADAPPLLGDGRLLEIARAVKPFIVVDSLIRFHEVEENSATGMATVMAAVRALCNAGASVLVLHHKPKNAASHYRGSSDIHAGADVNFSLSRSSGQGTLRLACFKNRHQPEETLLLKPEFDGRGDFVLLDPESEAAEAQREASNEDAQKLFVLIQGSPGMNTSDLTEAACLPEKRALRLLREFEGQLWRVENGPHGAKCYYPVERASPPCPF